MQDPCDAAGVDLVNGFGDSGLVSVRVGDFVVPLLQVGLFDLGLAGAFELAVDVEEGLFEIDDLRVQGGVLGEANGEGIPKGDHDVEKFSPHGESAETFDHEEDTDVEGKVKDGPDVLSEGTHTLRLNLVKVQHPEEIHDANRGDDHTDDVGAIRLVRADFVDGTTHTDDAFS